jgi:hypothetical protein
MSAVVPSNSTRRYKESHFTRLLPSSGLCPYAAFLKAIAELARLADDLTRATTIEDRRRNANLRSQGFPTRLPVHRISDTLDVAEMQANWISQPESTSKGQDGWVDTHRLLTIR